MTDRDTLAAEHALRLLDGEELMAARRLAAEDPAFAAELAAWEERLGPLFREVREVAPRRELWERIRESIRTGDGERDNVVALRRKLNRWRGLAAATSAMAAALALVVVSYDSTRGPGIEAPGAAAPVLTASLSGADSPTSLSVAFQADRRELLVTPGRLQGAAGHDHELWLIPAGGSPIPLGIIHAGPPQRVPLDARLTVEFKPLATIALSVEPNGGSPTGLPTGPVVASGQLALL